MTIEELKHELKVLPLPDPGFKMSEWETVQDARNFLNTQFAICEQAGHKYADTPAWERLLRFYEAVLKSK